MKRVFALMLVFALLCGCAPQAPAEPAPDPVTDPAPTPAPVPAPEPDPTLMTEPTRDPVPEPPAPQPEPEPVPEPEPLPVFWDEDCQAVHASRSRKATSYWVEHGEQYGMIWVELHNEHTFDGAALAVWKEALTDPNMEKAEKDIFVHSEFSVLLKGAGIGIKVSYGTEERGDEGGFYLCQGDGPKYRLSDEMSNKLRDVIVDAEMNHILLSMFPCDDLYGCGEIWMVKDPERKMTEQEAGETLMWALIDSLRYKKPCRCFVIYGGEMDLVIQKPDPETRWGDKLTGDQWCVFDYNCDWHYGGAAPQLGLFFDSCATLEYRDGAWYLYTWDLSEGTRDLPVQEVVR